MTFLSEADRALAAQAASANEVDLLLQLGEALAGEPARDSNQQNLMSRAEDWLSRNRERLKEAICGNPALTDLGDSMVDVATLADVLGAQLNRPTAFVVAAILIKRGIGALCS
ncbi:MAG: hypothetical protein IPH03_10835 [Tetrasphaera sp.]|nr:hypothetical protein [Tetrasphaera sp.]